MALGEKNNTSSLLFYHSQKWAAPCWIQHSALEKAEKNNNKHHDNCCSTKAQKIFAQSKGNGSCFLFYATLAYLAVTVFHKPFICGRGFLDITRKGQV
jgi:hypothetical protein